MPRYFFHLQSEGVVVPDTEGKEFGGMYDAFLHAQKIIRCALRFLDGDDSRWSVLIQTLACDCEVIVLFPPTTRSEPKARGVGIATQPWRSRNF